MYKNLSLHGERIYLRDVNENDVNEKYCSWMNDHEVTKLTAARGQTYTLEALRGYVSEQILNEDVIFLAIVLKGSDEHVGNIKIGTIDWKKRTGDIGIIIGEKAMWGKGLASEAIGILCDFVFKKLQLNDVTAGFFDGNKSSERAFLKNDFQIESISNKYLSDGSAVSVTWCRAFNKENMRPL